MHEPIAPFPKRLKSNKSNEQMKKMLKVFNQVKINLPLLDAIQKSHYTPNFLCAPRSEKPMSQRRTSLLPTSANYCLSPSYMIGQTNISRALLDLEESINLFPFSMYKQLKMGDLRSTRVTIQLTDRSAKISGKITDVII